MDLKNTMRVKDAMRDAAEGETEDQGAVFTATMLLLFEMLRRRAGTTEAPREFVLRMMNAVLERPDA
jgi:hypothetical protein